MINSLECFSTRHGNSSYYNLEFSKRLDINKYPLLTSKIEELSSIIKNDHLKFTLKEDGNIIISRLDEKKYVVVNSNDLDKTALSIIQSISKIAKEMNISSLKDEKYRPLLESSLSTYFTFDHKSPITKSTFPAKSFFQKLKKAFILKFIVRPTAKKMIQVALKNKSEKEMATLYVDNQKLFSSIKEAILNKSSSASEIFQPQELDTLINNNFLTRYNEILNKTASKAITKKEVYNLDVARIINGLQHHHLSKDEYKKLLIVSPLDIPIQELAKIPVTAENERALSHLWTHLMGNLFVKGNLANLYPGNNESQTKYALTYLEARSKLPADLHKHTAKLTDDLDGKQKVNDIKLYCIVNTDNDKLKNRLPLSKEIDLYNNKVKKEIKKFIKKNTKNEGSKIANSLVHMSKAKDLGIAISETFSPEERLIFTKKDIRNLLFMTIERLAVKEHEITESQLTTYKLGRNSPDAEDKRLFSFNEAGLDSLFNGKNDEEIKMHKDLLFVSKVLDKSAKKVTADEKKRLENILININENKKFRDCVKSYIENESLEELENFLKYLPKFVHSFVRKIFNPQDIKINDKKIPYGISSTSIKSLNGYLKALDSTNKSKSDFIKIQAKAQCLITKFQVDPLSIKPSERLTVQELAILTKLSRYAKSFKILDKLNLDFSQNLQFQNALEMINQSQDLLTKIEGFILPKLHLHYRSGDLLAYNASKKEKWHNASLSIEQKLTAFTSGGLTHGGKLFNDKKDVAISHVLGGIKHEKLDLYNICISDIYEIQIKHLVSPQMESTLKRIYGKQWVMHITKVYVDAESAIHHNVEEKFDQIENYRNRRVRAVLANFPRIANLLTDDEEIQSHKKTYESSRLGVYEEFFGKGPKGTEEICSEWASKATLAAMMEANRKLAEELAAETKLGAAAILANFDAHEVILPGNVREYLEGIRYWGKDQIRTKKAENELIKVLKENNYSKEQIELIIKIGNKEIFDIPYDRKERLKTIHPGRMVQLLEEKKCLKKREVPQVLAQLIAVE